MFSLGVRWAVDFRFEMLMVPDDTGSREVALLVGNGIASPPPRPQVWLLELGLGLELQSKFRACWKH